MIKNIKISGIITLFNLISGIMSIYFASIGLIKIAILLIILGTIFDKLDGFAARKLNQVSDFGIQLDSFADLISFGIAPIMLFWFGYDNVSLWMILLTLILPVAGVLRLSRYNINTKTNPDTFIGMPITLNGIILPILIFLNVNIYLFLLALVIISFLMVSNIKINKVF